MTALLKYSDFVESDLSVDKSKRKGERTRDRLILATLRILEKGEPNPKVSDICENAHVSPAAFYQYFRSIDELVNGLLCDWVETLYSYSLQQGDHSDAFGAMVAANRRMIELYGANPGLMRCLWKHREDNAEFAKVWERNNLTWYRGVRSAILEASDTSNLKAQNYDLCFYAISGLMDEFLRTIYIAQDPELLKIIKNQSLAADDLAEYLALIWHRLIYGCDPAGSDSVDRFFPNLFPRDH